MDLICLFLCLWLRGHNEIDQHRAAPRIAQPSPAKTRNMIASAVTRHRRSISQSTRAGYSQLKRSPSTAYSSVYHNCCFALNNATASAACHYHHEYGIRGLTSSCSSHKDKSIRLVSSSSILRRSFDGSPEAEEIPAPGPDQRQQRQDHSYGYGLSNFGKMLQHQDGSEGQSVNAPPKAPTKYQRKKSNLRRKIQKTTGHDFSGFRDRVSQERGDRGRASDERYRWRNRSSHLSQINGAPTRTDEAQVVRMPKATNSEWIMVTNVPPMVELSDLCHSLNQILDYEMQKGIIDLDALGNDDETLKALRQVGALYHEKSQGSLYSTQQIIDDGTIPLWTAPSPSSDQSHQFNHICPMILEARVHLSYRARPMGWFLRLPNRSVAHAVLSHVRRAEGERQRRMHLEKDRDEDFKQGKRQWREELWRGVWNEYESKIKMGESRAIVKHENHDEKEMMWGDDLGEEKEEDASLINPLEEGGETVHTMDVEEQQDLVGDSVANSFEEGDQTIQKIDVKEQQDLAGDYLQKYLEANQYPVQPPEFIDTEEYQYQLLKSGSTALDVKEFSPYGSDVSLPNDVHPPWDQHSFHLSPLLNLSDSVVRVETSVMKSSVEDIKFLFRGHDLDVISPVLKDNSTTLPSCFANFPRALGWNISSKSDNVACLVEGTHERRHRYARYANDPKDVVVRARRHAFLVRFASPADARMAVRDKQGSPYHNENLVVAQYPRQW